MVVKFTIFMTRLGEQEETFILEPIFIPDVPVIQEVPEELPATQEEPVLVEK